MVSKAGRAHSCRCRTAAIIAAPSALSRMAAAIRARCPWARWSLKCAGSARGAIAKWFSRASISPAMARICRAVRRLRPDVVFGGDIIAGFPTESEDMFARSLDLVDACGLTHLHVFPFSPRPGTPAARMPQIRRDVVKTRARRLREKGEAALHRHLEARVGARRQVLIESGELGRNEHVTRAR